MILKKVAFLVGSSFLFLMYGCGERDRVMEASFSSMDNCLESIERESGQSLDIITDELGNISGKLSNGKHFSCKTQESGTKGIYVEGWYTVEP